MCDTVVAITTDGRVLFGKNSDRDPNEAQGLEWRARQEHPEDAITPCTWIAIPEARRTHGVLLSRPYWMWGAEMGANEHGLVIGNEAVFRRGRRPAAGLTGMDLLRLALERAASRAEAVALMRTLLERHGQGGRCGYDDPAFTYDSSFLVADPEGAVVVETAGRELAVAPITSGARAISNGYTLPDFSDRTERLKEKVSRCRARRARMEQLAADATGPEHIARVLRDHGAGTIDPHYGPVTGAMGAPCMHAGGLVANSQTVGSFIAELDGETHRYYATGTAAPCLGAFKPVAVDRPVARPFPSGVHDAESDWWRFERVHRGIVGDPVAAARFRAARDDWERATWDGSRAPESAFDDWSRWLDEQAPSFAGTVEDRRPAHTRRYWARRDTDAHAPTPRLPTLEPT